jgi:hypothetical protein
VPFGVPPPPPRAAGRRARGGPSMLVIAAVSTVVIGSAATLIAVRMQPTSDDKAVPTVDVPASGVLDDPSASAAGPADPAATGEAPASPAASGDKPLLKLGEPAPVATTRPIATVKPAPEGVSHPQAPGGGAQIGARPTPPRPAY